MISSKMLLTVLALGASVSAFVVPENQADGVYAVDVTGKHVKVRDLQPKSRVYRSQTSERSETLDRRDNISQGCFARDVTLDDLAAAQGALKDLCGAATWLEPHTHTYAVKGGTVAYNCNYADGRNPCASGEIDTAFSSIKGYCTGTGEVGWWWQKDWNKSYGFDTAGTDICQGTRPA